MYGLFEVAGNDAWFYDANLWQSLHRLSRGTDSRTLTFDKSYLVALSRCRSVCKTNRMSQNLRSPTASLCVRQPRAYLFFRSVGSLKQTHTGFRPHHSPYSHRALACIMVSSISGGSSRKFLSLGVTGTGTRRCWEDKGLALPRKPAVNT